MRITLKGPASAMGTDDQPVTDPIQLRKFSGLKSGESCVEYFDEPLSEIYFEGGYLGISLEQHLCESPPCLDRWRY